MKIAMFLISMLFIFSSCRSTDLIGAIDAYIKEIDDVHFDEISSMRVRFAREETNYRDEIKKLTQEINELKEDNIDMKAKIRRLEGHEISYKLVLEYALNSNSHEAIAHVLEYALDEFEKEMYQISYQISNFVIEYFIEHISHYEMIRVHELRRESSRHIN